MHERDEYVVSESERDHHRECRLSNPSLPWWLLKGDGFEASYAKFHSREVLQTVESAMSMPRRAMKEMGFQACCLRCDAPDVAATSRCKKCISRHATIRDILADVSHDDSFSQFAKEMLLMAAEPHRHDHDEVNGPILIEQQRLAAQLTTHVEKRTVDDMFTVFDNQKQRHKTNILRDVANKNEWKDKPPTKQERDAMVEVFEENDHSDYGARTLPSRTIAKVDRSERVGEDVVLTDRITAAKKANEKPVHTQKETEKVVFEGLQSQRKEWKKVLSEVDDLLDLDE